MDGEPTLRRRQLCRREPRFSDRDPFVYALLGVIAYGRRVERVLRTLPAAPEAPSLGADRSIDVALGVIALLGRARRILERWAGEAEPEPDTARAHSASQAPRSEGLLR
ncbi:MAG: hypothetical protein DIU78_003905 [Pseudomonadota bacterium]|nr:MAG: hypothetical protein DIU78_04030 [Pseudomonadota bacterium]